MSQLTSIDAGPVEPESHAAVPAVLVRCKPSADRAAAAARALGRPAAEPVVPPPGRHLRVVDQSEPTPAQRRRRARAVLLTGALLTLGVAFTLVYLHVLLAQRQFSLDNLNAQVQQEQLTYQKLRLQTAQLGSPQNIISTAEGKLGMTQPASVTYLSPSTTTAASGSAGPAIAGGRAGQAPAGDANWPAIKSQLAGSP